MGRITWVCWRGSSGCEARPAGPLATLQATSAPVVPVATFDYRFSAARRTGDAPTKYKSCAEFEYYEDALAIFERAPEGVRKRLDRDGDGVPCPGLPHTTDRERYRFKKRSS